MNDKIVRISSRYDRDDNECWVVKHPESTVSAEMLAVYNTRTGMFKFDVRGNVKSFRSLDTAGHTALVDSGVFREAPNFDRLKYRLYEAS